MASSKDSNNSGSTEQTGLLITGHKLNGQNYLQWSHSVMMFICGRGKDDYLTGAASQPASGDPKFKGWKAENNMAMPWLINSMTNEVGDNFILYETVKEIWDAARETYSDTKDTAEAFEIEGILHDFHQGKLFVTQYYSRLTRYWQQLDMYETTKWECPTDATKYEKIVEKKHSYKFLLGLHKNLDEVRGRILAIKPLPNIREVASEVRREESRRKVMMGTNQPPPAYPANDNRSRNGRPWCDHCKKTQSHREYLLENSWETCRMEAVSSTT
ncbi:hypothetical protein BUALT_Bualt10G0021800 [Buddleja alternifolia]|uniref:Retrotransposon Copia-like N-terminal domain-containing protein n=1 Tax=Buddleja alternifolia TaxID=168488 RepID=A0AAV6X436_9LAMI|nr:hypothetical protein BUALT_Bualt10G0021800 [Buddleja alternifolia]